MLGGNIQCKKYEKCGRSKKTSIQSKLKGMHQHSKKKTKKLIVDSKTKTRLSQNVFLPESNSVWGISANILPAFFSNTTNDHFVPAVCLPNKLLQQGRRLQTDWPRCPSVDPDRLRWAVRGGKIKQLLSGASCPLHVFDEGLWKSCPGEKSLWKQTPFAERQIPLPVWARRSFKSIIAIRAFSSGVVSTVSWPCLMTSGSHITALEPRQSWALMVFSPGPAGERRLYLQPTLATNDNRWCLERSVWSPSALKKELFEEKWAHIHTALPVSHWCPSAHWAHSLYIQWALCNCWKIHSPPIYDPCAQQKGLQVAYLQLQGEIEVSRWCDDGSPPSV